MFYVPDSALVSYHYFCTKCDVRWVELLDCWFCGEPGERITSSNDYKYGTTFTINGGRWDPNRKSVPVPGGVAYCMDLDKEEMLGCL